MDIRSNSGPDQRKGPRIQGNDTQPTAGRKGDAMTTFNENMKKLRLMRRLTLREVADGVETAKSYIWEIENRGKNPSIDFLCRCAGFFGVTLDDLVGYGRPVVMENVPILHLKISEKVCKESAGYYTNAAEAYHDSRNVFEAIEALGFDIVKKVEQ